MVSIENLNFAKNKIAVELKFLVLQNITNVIGTSKCLDPLTPLTLLPIMCKCMYRKNRQETSHMQHGFTQGISKTRKDHTLL